MTQFAVDPEVIHRSIAYKLYTDIELVDSIKVVEFSNVETITSELEAGNTVIYWFVGRTVMSGPTHERVRVHAGALKKLSVTAALDCDIAIGKIQKSFLPSSSFVLYDLVGGSLTAVGSAVVWPDRFLRQEPFVDKDRYMNRPITFEIGYGQTLV